MENIRQILDLVNPEFELFSFPLFGLEPVLREELIVVPASPLGRYSFLILFLRRELSHFAVIVQNAAMRILVLDIALQLLVPDPSA
jgi:hypothetical protein